MKMWRTLYEQTLKTIFVLYYPLAFAILPMFGIVFITSLLFTQFYFISLLYISWMIYDRKTCNRGGRCWEWFRNSRVWTYSRDYFPIKLIKTCVLPADKNYLMCYHPHGVMCIGAGISFGSGSMNLKSVFPGLTVRMLAWEGIFWLPFQRENMFSFGMCSASKDSMKWFLTENGTGNGLVLIVGGPEESLEAHPGRTTLYLNRRKGFIKMALKYGASLVPMFAFGENDVFKQIPNPRGSLWRKIQDKFKDIVGFVPIFFYGRCGVLPFQRPITIVVGSPIHLEKIDEPTTEEINLTHQMYKDSLSKLFEEHKEKYGPNLQLQII